MVRGERLIKLRNSWFSSKHLLGWSGVVTVSGRELNGLGNLTVYRTQGNSECLRRNHWNQSVGDKLHGREGNNPDRQLRSLNNG